MEQTNDVVGPCMDDEGDYENAYPEVDDIDDHNENMKIIRTSITNILDDVNLGETDVVIKLRNGRGTYLIGETVYQGYSYETATATAKVEYWLPAANTLTISSMHGHFVTSSNVIGYTSHSTWIANNYSIVPRESATITITPNPSNVILPNNYTYTTTIVES